MALADVLTDVQAVLSGVTGIARAYPPGTEQFNEPGVVALVELDNEYEQITFGGTKQLTLRLLVVKAGPNSVQDRTTVLALLSPVHDAFAGTPGHADWWDWGNVQIGNFVRNETNYFGFSRQLIVVGDGL